MEYIYTMSISWRLFTVIAWDGDVCRGDIVFLFFCSFVLKAKIHSSGFACRNSVSTNLSLSIEAREALKVNVTGLS